MDQYLFPLMRMGSGRRDTEKVTELLECMWLAMAQFIDLYISPAGGAINEGYAHWEAVTVGGQTPAGTDAHQRLNLHFP